MAYVQEWRIAMMFRHFEAAYSAERKIRAVLDERYARAELEKIA